MNIDQITANYERDGYVSPVPILIEAEADLNALDAKSGDGDTGTTVATAARALSGALDRLPLRLIG